MRASPAKLRWELRRLVAGRLVRPLWLERVRGLPLTAERQAILASERETPEALRAAQLADLRRFCERARAATRFWAERLPPLPSRDTDLPHWLADVPPLTRADLQSQGDALRNRDPGEPVVASASGGSSGRPVRFVVGRSMVASSFALENHFYERMGIGPGEACVRIWGHPGDTHGGRRGLGRRLKELLLNDSVIDAFSLDEARVARIVDRLHALRPRLVVGYAGSLFQLCRIARALGRDLPAVGAVCSSAENLTPEWRAAIGEAFRAPVFDRYGTREVGAVGAEPRPGEPMVYDPRRHLLETVRPDGTSCEPGEEGELLVTALRSGAQPFLRYRIGDRASLGPAQGDLAWPRILGLGGRSVDLIRTPEGSSVSPIYFVHMIGVELNRGELSALQLEQTAIDRLVLRYVATPGVPDRAVSEALDRMESVMRPVLGQRMQIERVPLAEIPPSASGKVRYVISRLSES